MTLQGKGFFANDLSQCEGGDPAAITAAALAAGLKHVVIKIAEENQAVAVDLQGIDLMPKIVQSLQSAGLEVWGWHHIRGIDPEGEAGLANERVRALGLQGYVANAESDYEQPGRDPVARQFMSALRSSINVPVGLCSYPFPNFHPDFPWSAFLEGCEFHLPKVFWEQAHNAGEQLRESKRQCDALPNCRTYIPVGAAYRTTGWAPMPVEITDFLETAQALGLPAVSFFQWDLCRNSLPRNWEAVSNYAWPTPAVKPVRVEPDPFSTEFMTMLNSRQPAQVAGLYAASAVRTWLNETVHGVEDIQGAYTALFGKMPEGIAFTLTRARVDGEAHFLTWKAGSITGETTLVLKNGKIIQDHTFISS